MVIACIKIIKQNDFSTVNIIYLDFKNKSETPKHISKQTAVKYKLYYIATWPQQGVWVCRKDVEIIENVVNVYYKQK